MRGDKFYMLLKTPSYRVVLTSEDRNGYETTVIKTLNCNVATSKKKKKIEKEAFQLLGKSWII